MALVLCQMDLESLVVRFFLATPSQTCCRVRLSCPSYGAEAIAAGFEVGLHAYDTMTQLFQLFNTSFIVHFLFGCFF